MIEQVTLTILIILLVYLFMPKKEGYIVADAQDFHNYKKLKAFTEKESDTFDDQDICKLREFEEVPETLQGYLRQFCQPNKKYPFYEFIGYNYDKYSDSVTMKNFDIRILSQTGRGLPMDQRTKNIPVGYNYSFNNGP